MVTPSQFDNDTFSLALDHLAQCVTETARRLSSTQELVFRYI